MKNVAAIIVLFIALSVGGHAAAVEPLKVNTSIKPPFSTRDQTGFFDLLLKELGKRLDRPVELVRLPPKRALRSINNGLSDAELPRIAGLEMKYSNLVRVEEKVIDYNFVAFSRVERDETSWGDLAGKRVGYLIGWKIFEDNIPAQANACKLTKPELLFNMLSKGRIDVALYERYAGWNNIQIHQHSGINEWKTPMAIKPMFLYLHKKHAALAPVIDRHLRQMKSDGTYRRIMKQTLGDR